jgi:hypothetical protein
MQQIPVINVPNQIFNTVLNNIEVRFRIWYQDIGAGWFCSMEFADGTKILSGARLNSSSPLLASTVSDFEGDIVPTPTIAPGVELNAEPWGNTHLLLYLTPDELEEIGLASV